MNLDHRLTLFLRKKSASQLSFWKLVAGKGMWFFVVAWALFVMLGWMTWWMPVLPLVLSYITLLCVQAIVKRERPHFEKISGYRMWIRTYSFPSGHSTESTVLALALLLFPAFPSMTALAIAACALGGLALLVMYSRIAVGVHYVTDVLAGCALGTLYAGAFSLIF